MLTSTYSFNLKSGWPLVFENIETDTAKFVDIGVVDLSSEEHLGGHHGVLFGKEKFHVKHAAFIGRVRRACNLYEEMATIGLGGFRVNANYRFSRETLCLLKTLTNIT